VRADTEPAWSQGQMDQLRSLWAWWPTLTLEEIGLRIGKSKQSVQQKAKRMKLTRRTNPVFASREVADVPLAKHPHPDRAIAGLAPLAFMHPISWGVLMDLTPSLRAR
jgi:hypothetical protein